MRLISKLSLSCLKLSLPTPALEVDGPVLDLLERDAMECANRTVLAALPGGRMVAMVLDVLTVAGVEVYGLDAFDMSMDCDGKDGWSSESSIAGRDGSEGMSCPSTSSIRLHIRDGVSNIMFAILATLY